MASKEALAHLGMHPAWGELKELMRERKEKQFRQLALRLMNGDSITAEEVAFQRGFMQGMQFLIDNPALEAKKFYETIEKEGDPQG